MRNAKVEDVPLMIGIMRDVLYPVLENDMVSYDAHRIEQELRKSFHRDRLSIALHNGRCIGFMWAEEDHLGRGGASLNVKAVAIETFDGWEGALNALINSARDYAHSRGLEHIRLLRMRDTPSSCFYRAGDEGGAPVEQAQADDCE